MHILKVLLIIYPYFSVAFPEGAYKVILNRAEIVQQNEDFVRSVITVTRLNRYTRTFNMNIDLKVDVPHSFKINARVYEFLNNEYRPFAINIVRSYCDFLEMEYKTFLYPDLIRIRANMPEPKCPVLKGKYSLRNYTLSNELLPVGLPFQNGLLEFKMINGTRTELTAHVYFILDRDAIIRERYS